MSIRPSRRQFLRQSTTAGFALPLLLKTKRGLAATDRLNIAAVGVGGKGEGDIKDTSAGQNVVAICDVDERTLAKSQELYPKAKAYHDWRRMLEQQDIDAVTVSTPDHMHAPIAVSAMQLGKHVYVQKPMAHTIHEARRMQALATENGVVTQMGNQNHSGSAYQTVVKLVQAGAIGKVHEAHTWSNRPFWPQGIERPSGSDPVPKWLHWDLWLGVAASRPFLGAESARSERGRRRSNRGVYHPFNWRGWLDFGVGALGDMGCHIIDPVVWSLELDAPRWVWSGGPGANGETYPEWAIIQYEFPGTKYTVSDSLRMTWYDGGKLPQPYLAQLPADEKMPANGCLFIGERGNLLCEHGGSPRLLPEPDFADYEIEPVAAQNHYQQWTSACKGDGKTSSHFDYSGPLTETVLLGTIANRFPSEKLVWDSETMKVSNRDDANPFVHKTYRDGWSVDGI
jgi:predicted dehydrogenase